MALWGNINALLSRLEQSSNEVPGLIEQMGQEIHKAKRELLRVMGEEKRLRERAKTRMIEAQQWQSRAELAVRTGDDALARNALVQFRRLQDESVRDVAAADECSALAQSINTDVLQMEQKHAAYSARQGTLSTGAMRSLSGGGVESLGAQPGRTPFEDLRRAERSIEDAEFANDAKREVQEVVSPAQPDPPAGDAPNNSVAKRRVRVE